MRVRLLVGTLGGLLAVATVSGCEGIDARTGKKVFQFPADGYTPMISDGERAYLIGFVGLYGLTGR